MISVPTSDWAGHKLYLKIMFLLHNTASTKLSAEKKSHHPITVDSEKILI